eukprot:7386551-Prymnesium_polylepis.1
MGTYSKHVSIHDWIHQPTNSAASDATSVLRSCNANNIRGVERRVPKKASMRQGQTGRRVVVSEDVLSLRTSNLGIRKPSVGYGSVAKGTNPKCEKWPNPRRRTYTAARLSPNTKVALMPDQGVERTSCS